MFAKANERLNEIPEGAEAKLIEEHKDEIVSVTKDLMQAFLLDEKACPLNQRILKLAEQYELYVQTYNPEGTSTSTVDTEEEGAEQQTTIYTRDSVIFGKCLLYESQVTGQLDPQHAFYPKWPVCSPPLHLHAGEPTDVL